MRWVTLTWSTGPMTDVAANMVVSIILVNNPGFVNTPATQYGIFVAMTLFAPLSMICIGNRANRILEYILMALSCAGGLAIAITLLATQTPKASAVSYILLLVLKYLL